MLAPEGRIPVALAWLAAMLVTLAGSVLWAVPAWLFTAYLTYLFFERRPRVPPSPMGLVAPADGTIVLQDTRRDPWLERDAVRTRVRLRLPGVSTVRSPTEGKMLAFWTAPQPFDGAGVHAGASPNCYALHLRTDEGADVVLAISSAHPFSRLRLDVSPGERVGQGQRCGFVWFASYVDVLAPPGSRAERAPGRRVRAGRHLLSLLAGGAGS